MGPRARTENVLKSRRRPWKRPLCAPQTCVLTARRRERPRLSVSLRRRTAPMLGAGSTRQDWLARASQCDLSVNGWLTSRHPLRCDPVRRSPHRGCPKVDIGEPRGDANFALTRSVRRSERLDAAPGVSGVVFSSIDRCRLIGHSRNGAHWALATQGPVRQMVERRVKDLAIITR